MGNNLLLQLVAQLNKNQVSKEAFPWKLNKSWAISTLKAEDLYIPLEENNKINSVSSQKAKRR